MRLVAHACTALRIVLAPLFSWAIVRAHADPGLWPLILYAAAAASDFLDGRLARAAGTASVRGRLFDHGADALFLFPALFTLGMLGRVPLALPAAATIAFGLYLREGWRHGGERDGTIALQPSLSGAVGGILNYVIAGAAATLLAIGHSPLDPLLYAAAALATVANLIAIAERLRGLLRPIDGGRTLTSRIGRP